MAVIVAAACLWVVAGKGQLVGLVFTQAGLRSTLAGVWTTTSNDRTSYRFLTDGRYYRGGGDPEAGLYRLSGVNRLTMTPTAGGEVTTVKVSFDNDTEIRTMSWDAGTPREVVLVLSGR